MPATIQSLQSSSYAPKNQLVTVVFSLISKHGDSSFGCHRYHFSSKLRNRPQAGEQQHLKCTEIDQNIPKCHAMCLLQKHDPCPLFVSTYIFTSYCFLWLIEQSIFNSPCVQTITFSKAISAGDRSFTDKPDYAAVEGHQCPTIN